MAVTTLASFGAHESELLTRSLRGEPLADLLRDHVLWIEERARHTLLASVLLIDASGTHLTHGAAPSLPDAYNAAIDGIAVGPRVGSCGTAAYCGHPIYVADIATDPLWQDFKDLALAHGLRACWSAPILVGNRVAGTFAIYYRERRAPGDEDRAIVQRAAETVARLLGAGRPDRHAA